MSNAATYPRYKITAKMRVEFSKVHKGQKRPVSLKEAKAQIKVGLNPNFQK